MFRQWLCDFAVYTLYLYNRLRQLLLWFALKYVSDHFFPIPSRIPIQIYGACAMPDILNKRTIGKVVLLQRKIRYMITPPDFIESYTIDCELLSSVLPIGHIFAVFYKIDNVDYETTVVIKKNIDEYLTRIRGALEITRRTPMYSSIVLGR